MPRPEHCLLATCQGRLAPTSQLEALAARQQSPAPGEGMGTGEKCVLPLPHVTRRS